MRQTQKYLDGFAAFVGGMALLGLISWLIGEAFLYREDGPVMSPFTYLSLVLMIASRLAHQYLEAWPTPLSMAILGLCIGGNLSSLMALGLVPTLLQDAFPALVPTSMATSIGIIFFCSYDLLVLLRKTPRQGFILDDILLHLALLPGAISLLGHGLGKSVYISSEVDPRAGISVLEMGFMASYAVVATLSNRQLFLWRFLEHSLSNRLIFLILVANQFLAPLIVGGLAASNSSGIGIELFVLLAGVFATLGFLSINAWREASET